MFETIEAAPPDAIFSLNEAFKADTNPDKINLTVGVYQNEQGVTPILNCVKAAERKLLENEQSKSYLSIDGILDYRRHVAGLLLGPEHAVIRDDRVASVQTPGGTGALRVAADLIKRSKPNATMWCSKPTWANHPNIFRAAGLAVDSFDYLDSAGTGFDFEAMIDAINHIPAGDVICLHGCCHNPTGADPTGDQWKEIAAAVKDRRVVPLIDFAYQGFWKGLDEDAFAIRWFADHFDEMLVCNSFSKSLGLYSERVGALTIVGHSPESKNAAHSQAKSAVRCNYSNPPKHGAAIVETVLSDEELGARWQHELQQMRERIAAIRTEFVKNMEALLPGRDFGFVQKQNGMFSYSGLNRLQVDRLRTEYSIYIIGSGRINVAGINPSNMERLCNAVAAVMKDG